VGQPVKDYLPPDDEKSRKNTMWRLLFEYFDKIDGKPSKTDVKVHVHTFCLNTLIELPKYTPREECNMGFKYY